ncbi:MAG: hypothetical protein L0Y55_14595 [Anaerolineales bacterium]|nr:hypothetical protein [Anaerolineales bacterium]
MNRRIVRILRTAVITMMALVFVGCSEKGCAPDNPHLAIANDTDLPVMVRVTGGDQDRALNMLPESKESFVIAYDTVYDVRILSDAFVSKLTRKRDSVWQLIRHLPSTFEDKADRERSRALNSELEDLDRQVKAELKPEKAVASCKAGPSERPSENQTGSWAKLGHLYANITRDSKGNLQVQCGKR